jgi:hypothetical protein
MSISKTERRIVIAVGIGLGVAISSMLVRYALDVKAEQVSRRPGNYTSMVSAEGNHTFPSIPDTIERIIPNGIVVYFEGNQTGLFSDQEKNCDYWVIETSGSFRSERLFVLVEHRKQPEETLSFFRASELYVRPENEQAGDRFADRLDTELFREIGKNSKTGDLIIQIKEFSPPLISRTIKQFSTQAGIVDVRLIPWTKP